jgi:hypothetical protein
MEIMLRLDPGQPQHHFLRLLLVLLPAQVPALVLVPQLHLVVVLLVLVLLQPRLLLRLL